MRKSIAPVLGVLFLVAAPPVGFAWGREGHEVVALIAEQNMTPAALERAKAILGGASLEEVASWADHDEDNGDKGGNDRRVILDGHPDNLHFVWDTGLLEHIDRNPQALAGQLESRITPQDRAEWTKGTIEDWVMEGQRLAISYAEWLAREVETAEIRVYNRDGSLADSRVIGRAGQPEQRD